jgi:hypothetical protein
MGNMGINRLIVIDSMRFTLIGLTIGKRELMYHYASLATSVREVIFICPLLFTFVNTW